MGSEFEDVTFLNLVELDDILPNCEFLDLTDCTKFNHVPNSLTIGHLNIHSIPSKFDDLNEMPENMFETNLLPDVLLLSETFLSEMNYDKYSFPNYQMVYQY